MKKYFSLISMFMLCLYGIGAETETTLMDAYQIYVTAENGKTGSSAELTLNMKNRNAIFMWKCDLVLPTGITFREAALVYDRIPNGYNPDFKVTQNDDGTITLISSVAAEEDVYFIGTDGPVATVTVDIDGALEPNDYIVTVKNAMLEEPENLHKDPKERSFTWTIEQGIVYGTITFDLGGAPGEYAPITAPVGDAIDAPDDPEWEGHNFLGWNPSIPETMPEGGLTVTAQWEIKKFKVYVEGDGVQIENPEPEWGGTVIIFVEDFPDRVLEALYVNQRNVIDLMEGNTYTINDVQYDIYVNAVFRTTKTTITIEQDYTPYSSA